MLLFNGLSPVQRPHPPPSNTTSAVQELQFEGAECPAVVLLTPWSASLLLSCVGCQGFCGGHEFGSHDLSQFCKFPSPHPLAVPTGLLPINTKGHRQSQERVFMLMFARVRNFHGSGLCFSWLCMCGHACVCVLFFCCCCFAPPPLLKKSRYSAPREMISSLSGFKQMIEFPLYNPLFPEGGAGTTSLRAVVPPTVEQWLPVKLKQGCSAATKQSVH